MSAIRPAAAKSCAIWRGTAKSRVAKAAIISAVPPLMVKTEANPDGLPKERFRRSSERSSRPTGRKFYYDLAGRTVLWLQPAGRESFRAGDLELVAPGHDGRRQGAL